MKQLITIKFITTMQQVSIYRRKGGRLYCTCPGTDRTPVQDIRYGQGWFQVKIKKYPDEWMTPSKVWFEPGCPNLWDLLES